MTHTIYIVDRANQMHTEDYPTADAVYNAADRWEADGHDVYTDRLQACLAKDKFARFMLRQGQLIIHHVK